jgi:hypothetical protein
MIMSLRSEENLSLGRSCGAIVVVAASMLAPNVGLSEPASTAARPARACELHDARLEQTRREDDEARAAADEARARLVREHLRLTDPTALLDVALDEEEFEATRAELRAARADVAQAEGQPAVAGCDAM